MRCRFAAPHNTKSVRTLVRLLCFAGIALAALLAGCPLLAPPSPYANLDLSFNVDTAEFGHITEPPLKQTETVVETIAGAVGHHAPTLVELPSGDLLAAWYSYVGPGELDGAAVYTARHSATTATWSQPTRVTTRVESTGNPVLYQDGDVLRLFCAVVPGTGWSTAHIEQQTSTDDGETWSSPRIVSPTLGSNVRYPPVRLDDGMLLLPAYDDLLQRALFFASTDGETWSLRSVLATDPPHQCIQPSLALLDSGRILAVLRNTGGDWLWVTASDDGGYTWAEPRDSNFPNPASPATVLRLASNNLVLALNNSETDRHSLSITLSHDSGQTWYRPRVIAEGDGEYAYPAAIQTADGLIHMVYSDNRQRITHVALNEVWVYYWEECGTPFKP